MKQQETLEKCTNCAREPREGEGLVLGICPRCWQHGWGRTADTRHYEATRAIEHDPRAPKRERIVPCGVCQVPNRREHSLRQSGICDGLRRGKLRRQFDGSVVRVEQAAAA